jgi:hypothetical protein
VFSHLEAAGIAALVVNTYHVKNVPGRKTDVSDAEWLAQLARFGLLRGSFIPPKDLRELRIVSRYRRKLSAAAVGEKNRLHKPLDDAGIKLGGVVADIDGVCKADIDGACKMVEGLIAGDLLASICSIPNILFHDNSNPSVFRSFRQGLSLTDAPACRTSIIR